MSCCTPSLNQGMCAGKKGKEFKALDYYLSNLSLRHWFNVMGIANCWGFAGKPS